MKPNFQLTQCWMMEFEKLQLKKEYKNDPNQLGLTC
jgi:hypothetical protein